MKAYYSTAYGGPEVSHFGDIPDPSASNGQLLIEVKAVSLNPVDFKVKKGIAKFMSNPGFPRIPAHRIPDSSKRVKKMQGFGREGCSD
jgi:NADPH:quinone reductase-like Zn-dependent oxidoreductase